MYESVEEAKKRLNNTLVLYDNTPVYIDGVGRLDPDNPRSKGIGLTCRTLPSYRKRENLISLKDKKLNFKKLRLGYVNGKKSCVYVERLPVRRYKQGLNSESIRISGPIGPEFDDEWKQRADVPAFERMLKYAGFAKMLKGNYPSYKQALNALEDAERELDEVSFHRHLCLSKDATGIWFLHHKTERVGYVLPDNGKAKLGPNFSYLVEKIDSYGVDLNV